MEQSHLKEKLTVAILAGGKSSRMGSDKGLLVFNGKELIQHVIDSVSVLNTPTVLVTNNEAYGKFGLPTIADEIPNSGPIGGIFTALKHASTDWVCCVACDMPFLNAEVIRFLFEIRDHFQAIVPFHEGNPEPLCSLYHRSGITIFEEMIRSGRYKIQDAYARLRFHHATIPNYVLQGKNPFRNFNTPGDLEMKS